MSDSQEAYAKIVTEIRSLAQCAKQEMAMGIRGFLPTVYGKPLDLYFAELADRIEAAGQIDQEGCADHSNETLKDITAEMRKYRDFVITQKNYPDRIDAAEERAWASHAATIEANEALRRRLVVVTERCDNVAKLRKVLMELRDHVESGTRAEIIIDTALAATADQTESEVPGGNAR